MAPAVYILGTLVCLSCAVLLIRAYLRVRKSLLLWSGLCFAGLTISNALVFVDLVIFPDIDLYPLRLVTAAIAMVLLLYGLIWESE
ncbi:MAG TPA: DUF5985 family protein [Bryobacteraceae bacterium]|jgi:hypothetical protein|nr:DUF5985 family protein [Bryobacteraceae bacterium]